MKKNKSGIMKEAIIFILLIILIMLILAVALYDFIPAKISMPEPIEYSADSTTTSIKQEIAYTNGGDMTADESNQGLITSLKSYSVESADLTMYGQKNLYNSGNSNPFDYAEEEKAPAEGENPTYPSAGTTNEQTTTNSSTAGQKTESKTGTFFESKTSK